MKPTKRKNANIIISATVRYSVPHVIAHMRGRRADPTHQYATRRSTQQQAPHDLPPSLSLAIARHDSVSRSAYSPARHPAARAYQHRDTHTSAQTGTRARDRYRAALRTASRRQQRRRLYAGRRAPTPSHATLTQPASAIFATRLGCTPAPPRLSRHTQRAE